MPDGDGQPLRETMGAALGRSFPPAMRWQALGLLGLFAAADALVAAICPYYGGDCLYGLFSLIAAPVMAAGLLGVLMPRAARAAGWGWLLRLGVFLAGGAAAAALVLAGHVVAVHYWNGPDYGEVWVKPRLLRVTLALALAYYTALAAISLAPRPDPR